MSDRFRLFFPAVLAMIALVLLIFVLAYEASASERPKPFNLHDTRVEAAECTALPSYQFIETEASGTAARCEQTSCRPSEIITGVAMRVQNGDVWEHYYACGQAEDG